MPRHCDDGSGILAGSDEPYKAGQQVRWKERARWRYGHLGDPPVGRDGSLRIFDDDFNGSARALRPADVERLQRGPRGGRKWVPCDPCQDAEGGMRSVVASSSPDPLHSRDVLRRLQSHRLHDTQALSL